MARVSLFDAWRSRRPIRGEEAQPLSLWRQADFLKLWTGQSVSLLGSQVTRLALPLAAALVLQASPAQVSWLGTLNTLPYVIVGLLAGVWVDRWSRRRVMILADLGRALLLGSIPVAALLGWLGLPQLYLVAFGVGWLNVFFGAAYGSVLPSLVRRENLLEGNTKLVLSEAIARVGGPALAGVLIEVANAPLAIGVDALSFLVSAGCVWRLRPPPRPAPGSTVEHHLSQELRDGLAFVRRHPLLGPMFGAVGLGSLADGLVVASGLGVVYGSRELQLDAVLLGAAISSLGLGGLLGAAVGGSVVRHLGPGRTFIVAAGVWSSGYAVLALAGGSPALAGVLLALGFGILGAINPIAVGTYATLRQVSVPDRLLGRVTAIGQVLNWGGLTVGTLAAGVLADRIGLRGAVALACIPPLLALLWMSASPVRTLRQLPTSTANS